MLYNKSIIFIYTISKWFLRKLPPRELLHDPYLSNGRRETCASLWRTYVKTPVPKELLTNPNKK